MPSESRTEHFTYPLEVQTMGKPFVGKLGRFFRDRHDHGIGLYADQIQIPVGYFIDPDKTVDELLAGVAAYQEQQFMSIQIGDIIEDIQISRPGAKGQHFYRIIKFS